MSSVVFKHFKYSEPDTLGFSRIVNPDRFGLRLGVGSTAEFCLLRLVLGSVIVENTATKAVFESTVNYSLNPLASTAGRSLISLFHDAFPAAFKRNDLLACLNKNRSNTSFYLNILFELSHTLICTGNERHTQAFIHLYRVYEHIAYTFPLLYLRKETSYGKTYNTLKEYFADGGDSEIAFCRQFIEKSLNDVVLASPITIDFRDDSEVNMNVINRLAVSNKLVSTTYAVSVCYRDVWDLIIEIRNKYFHHLSGRSNSIDSQQLVNPDSFFECINRIGLQLFSTLYLSIVTSRM